MILERLKKVFTFNGIAVIIGITGSLASILTVFITEWDSEVSIKWLVLTIFLSLAILLILFKLLLDVLTELKRITPNSSKVHSYSMEMETFLVENNDTIGHAAMVSIFYIDGAIEIEMGKGYVSNIQEHFTQIKMLEFANDFQLKYSNVIEKIASNNVDILRKIVVKSYIKYSN